METSSVFNCVSKSPNRMALLAKSSNRRNSEIRTQPQRSISFDLLRGTILPNPDLPNAQQLSPPTPFADDLTNSVDCSTSSSATLPRPPSRTTSRGISTTTTTTMAHQRPLSLAVCDSSKNNVSKSDNKRKCRTLPRNCCRTIPPPPQYKGTLVFKTL